MKGSPTAAVSTESRAAKLGQLLKSWSVPLFFLALSAAGVIAAKLDLNFLIREIITRFGRNAFLVLSLIIPVIAGLGLNFGIVVGAMAGQTALVIITHYDIRGLAGFGLAALVAVPFAVLFGYLTGLVLNRAKGKEMVTGMILLLRQRSLPAGLPGASGHADRCAIPA